MKHAVVAGMSLFVVAGPVFASETISYGYDAKGRLVRVSHSGSVNNGTQTTYAHDKVDNRTRVQTQGAQH